MLVFHNDSDTSYANYAGNISSISSATTAITLNFASTVGTSASNDAIVLTVTAGKEEEATLEFVRDCGEKWNVPIVWLEYTTHEIPKERFKIVDFKTASREGEPLLCL